MSLSTQKRRCAIKHIKLLWLRFVLWLASEPISELTEELNHVQEVLGYAQDRFYRAEKKVEQHLKTIAWLANSCSSLLARAQDAEAEIKSLEREVMNTRNMLDEYTPDHLEMEKIRKAKREVDEIVNGPRSFCPECYDGERLGGKPEDCPRCHGKWNIGTSWRHDPVV